MEADWCFKEVPFLFKYSCVPWPAGGSGGSQGKPVEDNNSIWLPLPASHYWRSHGSPSELHSWRTLPTALLRQKRGLVNNNNNTNNKRSHYSIDQCLLIASRCFKAACDSLRYNISVHKEFHAIHVNTIECSCADKAGMQQVSIYCINRTVDSISFSLFGLESYRNDPSQLFN